MGRRKNLFWLILIDFLSFASLIYLIISFPPNWKFGIGNLELEILPLFLISLFLFISSFFGFLFKNLRRGVFLGLFTICSLLLRFFGLTQIFFIILLAILFLILEIVFVKK